MKLLSWYAHSLMTSRRWFLMQSLIWMTPPLMCYALYQKSDGFAMVWAGVIGIGIKFYFDEGQHKDVVNSTSTVVAPTTTVSL
jgi:hypothetical protein